MVASSDGIRKASCAKESRTAGHRLGSTLSWGLQVHQCLLRRIHGCVIPGRSSTKGSVGPSGTCFSNAGVPLWPRRWSICGGIMLGWVGSPPRRYREDTWPQVVVHLKPPPCTQQVFRNRFHPTTSENEIYTRLCGKFIPRDESKFLEKED